MKEFETSFERFEFKYWLSQAEVSYLLRFAEPFIRADDRAPGGQRNTSLYLDSPQLDFARQHIERAPDRVKLRIRVYGQPAREPAFVEIKRKAKAVTLKQRAIVPLSVLPALLSGDNLERLPLDSEQRATLSQFQYLMLSHHAVPQLLVTAHRRAYASIFADENVRLTLDSDICYQPARGTQLFGTQEAWINLCGISTYTAQSDTLMEIKFRGRAPAWLRDLTQQLNLRRTRFSKYIAAVQSEALGPEGMTLLARTPAPLWFRENTSKKGAI